MRTHFFSSMMSTTCNLTETSFDPFPLIHFHTVAWRRPWGTPVWPCDSVYKRSRQSEKQKTDTCPAETSPAHLVDSTENRQTNDHKLSQTRSSQRSHLQVVQRGHSLFSLGLCQPPIGCGCSPSTGHNGPSGRSGCRWNSLVGPAPPKTLSPCPTPSGSHQW